MMVRFQVLLGLHFGHYHLINWVHIQSARINLRNHAGLSIKGGEMRALTIHRYNGCVFAYGQTGSGKSYSMMG